MISNKSIILSLMAIMVGLVTLIPGTLGKVACKCDGPGVPEDVVNAANKQMVAEEEISASQWKWNDVTKTFDYRHDLNGAMSEAERINFIAGCWGSLKLISKCGSMDYQGGQVDKYNAYWAHKEYTLPTPEPDE